MISQNKYCIDIVREGLSAIAASKEVQLDINRNFGEHIDEVFDRIPLDSIQHLVRAGLISKDLHDEIVSLYKSADIKVGDLHHNQEDRMIKEDHPAILELRASASSVLSRFEKAIQ